MLSRALNSEFEAFVLARSAALLRTAYLLTGDRQHAEDLLQTVLWRASRRWSLARDNPHAYARRALVNLSRDRHRLLSRRLSEAPAALEGSTDAPSATDLLLDRDLLVRALRQMPKRQRITVILRFWEDLSVEETAQTMQCSTGTVKSNTSRGLVRLRELLEETERV